MLLETIEKTTGNTPEWSVIWLHGLGADGHDFESIIPELIQPHWPAIRFVFPNAPVRAVTLNNGAKMRAWYDLVSLDFSQRADRTGITESVQQIEALIQREVERGIPINKIFLAGFSQGGAVTLAVGLQQKQALAGLIALSTYLPDPNNIPMALAPETIKQPIFMAHGQYDPVIPMNYAEISASILRNAGFAITWNSYSMVHQVSDDEIKALSTWLDTQLKQQ